MARRRGGSRVQGVPQLRRFLRRLEPSAREELSDELRATGNRLLGRSKAEVPRRTGKLASMLAMRVSPKSLRLRLGLVTKRTARDGFYGYILDAGRKAQSVRVRRRTPSGNTTNYVLRVRAIPKGRFDFVFGRVRDFRANELPRFRSVLDRILKRASGADG